MRPSGCLIIRSVALWERSDSLDLLEGLLRASAGSGRVALVAAEAGMGKSTLVADFARRLGGRARVLWGVCDQLVTVSYTHLTLPTTSRV